MLACQSSLISDLCGRDGLEEGFGDDEIQNLYQDPSDWTAEQCREYARDEGIDLPIDPWSWSRDQVVEALTDIGIDCRDDETVETLREALIVNIDDETYTGLADLRDACREHAQDHPAEVYEWWLVSGWLCGQLKAIGEVVIDNGYGCWWGRCCTGQGWIMDGTLQRVARSFEREG